MVVPRNLVPVAIVAVSRKRSEPMEGFGMRDMFLELLHEINRIRVGK